MSEREEDLPQEGIVEVRQDEFQREMLEYIRDAKKEFQIMNEQIMKLSEEVKTVKENAQDIIEETMKGKKVDDGEEILSQGFSSYSFTPFPKDKQDGKGKMNNFNSQSEDEDKEVSNKKLVNNEDDSDDSDEDDDKDDKIKGKIDGRKSFMREANEAGTLTKTKGFQKVIVQPPNFSLMLKGVSKDAESVKFIKHFITKFNHHHKSYEICSILIV